MLDQSVWRLPDYGTRSFDLLPATIERLLGGRDGGLDIGCAPLAAQYDHVVLIYFDAFGWRFAERHGDHPLLAEAAAVERMTSQFPSTTTVHTPTIHSGLSGAEHGLYEWNVLEPSLDRLITPLLFCFAGDEDGSALAATGLDAAELYPQVTLYERLALDGIASHVAQPAPFAHSVSSRAMLRGSAVHGFWATRDAFAAVGAGLRTVERGYGFVYVSEFDSLMHDVGPDDPAASVLCDATLSAMHVAIGGGVFPPGTLVLVTADHGMASVSPEKTAFVNVLAPEVIPLLAVGADGKPLAPAGSARDLFLHVRPGEVEHVVAVLGTVLEGVAEVYAVEQLVDEGLFGLEASAALRARLGDVVCLPYGGEAVFWLEPGRFEQNFHGHHGGLTREEIEIPLVAHVTG